MAAVHAYAPRELKGYSLTAFVFMGLMAGVTCGLHIYPLGMLFAAPVFRGGGLARAPRPCLSRETSESAALTGHARAAHLVLTESGEWRVGQSGGILR